MREVFRSFEGKLGVENRSGYVIKESERFYQVEFLDVNMDTEDSFIRISKDIEFDFKDLEKLGEIHLDILNGCYDCEDCQVQYRGKWYSCKKIREIQKNNNDKNWRRYV